MRMGMRMRKRMRMAASVALLALLSGAVEAAPTSGATLKVSWCDGHRLVPDVDLVRQEVERILREAGVDVQWSDGSPRAAARAPRLEVTVIVSPSDPGGAGFELKPGAMGVYLREDRSSAVFVFYPRLVGVLGLSAAAAHNGGLLTPRERKTVARALGRVVVHELVHRVAPTVSHSSEGVMQARLNRSPLTWERLDLDEPSRRGLLDAISRSPVDAPPRSKTTR
jgi:hypothetical protein